MTPKYKVVSVVYDSNSLWSKCKPSSNDLSKCHEFYQKCRLLPFFLNLKWQQSKLHDFLKQKKASAFELLFNFIHLHFKFYCKANHLIGINRISATILKWANITDLFLFTFVLLNEQRDSLSRAFSFHCKFTTDPIDSNYRHLCSEATPKPIVTQTLSLLLS